MVILLTTIINKARETFIQLFLIKHLVNYQTFNPTRPAKDVFKTALKRSIQKTVKATGILIANKIADKTTEVPKDLQQNNSETVTNEHDKEIPKERYTSSEEKQEMIDELRLKQYNSEISKNIKFD